MPSAENKSKEQKAAESEVESFRKDLGPFVVAAETTRMAMVFADAKEGSDSCRSEVCIRLTTFSRHGTERR